MTTQERETPSTPPPNAIPTGRPLTPSEFNTALVHLYRGEISRANTWRLRLDGTTNWAVLTTGATLSFAFSNATNTHVMILLNTLLIGFFLFIEARRYRYYDLWRARIRLMETEFFSGLLVPENTHKDSEHWRELLANDLMHPHFNMSLLEATSRRLRRNYSWIFAILVASWIIKIIVHPTPSTAVAELVQRAGIGPINGYVVLAAGVLFNMMLFVVALSSSEIRKPWLRGDGMISRNEARALMGKSQSESG